MGQTLPKNYFQSSSVSSVYGSVEIILPTTLKRNSSQQSFTLQCRMKYLGMWRQGEEIAFDMPCTWNDWHITGTTNLSNGQTFSINIDAYQFGNKTLFNGRYISVNPGDFGILHYEIENETLTV